MATPPASSEQQVARSLAHSQDSINIAALGMAYARDVAETEAMSDELIAVLAQAAELADQWHQLMFDALTAMGIGSEEELRALAGAITPQTFGVWRAKTMQAQSARRRRAAKEAAKQRRAAKLEQA